MLLQRAIGNRAVQRLLAREAALATRLEPGASGICRPTIQRTVNGDITQQSITPEWARNLTDSELQEQLTIVRNQLSQLGNSGPEAETARANLEILENDAVRRKQGSPVNAEKQADQSAQEGGDAAFFQWWKLVVGFEGSLEQWKAQPGNKSDRGGETNWGVTKQTYMAHAAALGLPPTEEGFAAMTAEQAMRFGRMIWKASGADRIKNPGVAIVLADWYWGGIDLGRFSAVLKSKGRAATFDSGKPDAATIDFMNSLPPGELVELMSNAKAAQYRNIAKRDPSQKKFLEGWLKRNEERRRQAWKYAPPPKPAPAAPRQPDISIWDHAQRALGRADAVLEKGTDASYEEKKSALDDLWAAVGRIEQRQMAGLANEEEKMSLRDLKGQLLNKIGRLMDLGR